jgi:hypothetical protein
MNLEWMITNYNRNIYYAAVEKSGLTISDHRIAVRNKLEIEAKSRFSDNNEKFAELMKKIDRNLVLIGASLSNRISYAFLIAAEYAKNKIHAIRDPQDITGEQYCKVLLQGIKYSRDELQQLYNTEEKLTDRSNNGDILSFKFMRDVLFPQAILDSAYFKLERILNDGDPNELLNLPGKWTVTFQDGSKIKRELKTLKDVVEYMNENPGGCSDRINENMDGKNSLRALSIPGTSKDTPFRNIKMVEVITST